MGYAVSAAALSAFSPHSDLNVFMTQPPLFAAWGAALKALRKQPYFVITMDLYPWIAIEAGLLSRGAPTTRTLERLSVATLRRARGVIVIGRCMAERVRAFGVDRSRIHIITNWANTNVVRPVEPEDNELRRTHGLHDKFVVMYSGNLGVSHYFDDLLEVAQQLREQREIVFLFVGRGSRLKEVTTAIEERRLSNVRCLDHQPYEKLAQSLTMGDVHFVSLREGFEGLVVPSKAYGVLAGGRPIIYQGSPSGEIARMVAQEDIGLVTPQADTASLRNIVLQAWRRPEWRKHVGVRARALAESRYGMLRSLDAYATLLEQES